MKYINKIIPFVLAALLFTACKKEEHAKSSKTYLLKKRTYSTSTSSWSMEYSFDANDKITSYAYTNTASPSLNYSITYLRDASGKVTRYNYSYTTGTTGYGIYQYNSSNQVVREDVYIGAARNAYYINSYNNDNYEIASYDGSGAYQGKTTYYYTTDKKNVSNKKSYNAANTLTSEVTYIYTNMPNVISVYPESEIQKNYIGFVSQNAPASQTTTYPNSTPSNSTSYSYTTNADGYIVASKSIYTSGTTSSTTNGTIEYIVK